MKKLSWPILSKGEFLTTTFARTYTKDGEAHDTSGFTGRDLLVVAQLAQRAYYWARRHRSMQESPQPQT